MPFRVGNGSRTWRNCWHRRPGFVCQSTALAHRITGAAGPATCFIPNADLHSAGSNTSSVRGSVLILPSSSIELERSSLRTIQSAHKMNWLTIDSAFLRIDANRTDQPARCCGGGKCPPQIARRNQNCRTTNKDESCLLESVVYDPRPQNRCPPRALLANSNSAGPGTILSLKSAHGARCLRTQPRRAGDVKHAAAALDNRGGFGSKPQSLPGWETRPINRMEPVVESRIRKRNG